MATLEDHGTDEQKQTYLTKVISGTWSGTMCLTEPHCGTDLGQLKTKAVPKDDGSYNINGTKIFISAGEHDLTENIVHIVLAKLPDAPRGTKGISLFIIPKFLPAADGSVGERNGVRCGSIEHKMGIHGNGTAMLNFDDATGFLIGEPHNGLNAMFTYMNVARIGTASQGSAAAAERSYQGASKYARERLAMRSLSGVKNPDGPADPIIAHPDVRRMLLTQRAIAEGGRAMVTYASQFADLYMGGKTEEAREVLLKTGSASVLRFLKGFITEQGVIAANHGVQVFGGHGYIQEWGMEQILRDSRIGTLYEGTTGIQALDLIGRKVLMDRFKQLKIFTGEMLSFAAKSLPWPRGNKMLRKQAWTLAKLALKWRYLGYKLAMQGKRNPDAVGAGSADFLMYSGYAYMAFMWAKISAVAQAQLDAGEGDSKFLQEKLHTAEFFFERMLPQAQVHAKTIGANLDSVMAMPVDYFDVS